MNCQGKTFQGKFKVPALSTVRLFFSPSHLAYTEILNFYSAPFFYSLPVNLAPSKSYSLGAWQQRIFILLRCRQVTNYLNSELNNNQQKDTASPPKRSKEELNLDSLNHCLEKPLYLHTDKKRSLADQNWAASFTHPALAFYHIHFLTWFLIIPVIWTFSEIWTSFLKYLRS